MGGVVSFNGGDFETINGFPNDFWGWGGEDDELGRRVRHHGIHVRVPRRGRVVDMETNAPNARPTNSRPTNSLPTNDTILSIRDKMTVLKANQSKNMIKYELLEQHKANQHINGLTDVVGNMDKFSLSTRLVHGCSVYSVVLPDVPYLCTNRPTAKKLNK